MNVSGNSAGEYVLGVSRVGRTDKGADACVLLPNTQAEYEFPGVAVQSTPKNDAMHFEFAVESFTVPQRQSLRFDIFDFDVDAFNSAIVNEDPSYDEVLKIDEDFLESEGIASGAPCAGEGCELSFEAAVPNPKGPSQRLMWRVARTANQTERIPFGLAWTTELTVLFGGAFSSNLSASWLQCIKKTDPSPHDEVEVSVNVDGVQMLYGTKQQIEVGEFKPGGALAMDPVLTQLGWPWRYKTNIGFLVVESDITTDDSYLVNIPPRPEVYGPRASEQLMVTFFYPDDGFYEHRTMVSHGLQAFTAK